MAIRQEFAAIQWDKFHADQQRPRFAPVYALLEEAVADGVFPGCTFGVLARDRGRVWQVAALGAVGRQTYDEGSPEVHPETRYDLASVTKVVVTTAMAMLLYQRRILDLDMALVKVLPGFANGQAERDCVTIRHLLAHSSGLAGYARLFEAYPTPEALFAECLRMPLEAAPGVRAEYSDIGFILLGRALEVLAGQTLDEFAGSELFAPLGMARCCFRPEPGLRGLVPPTEDDKTFRHRVIQGEVQDENCWVLGGVSGHAGLFGTALDLLRFSQAILSAYLFEPETVQLFAERVGALDGSSRALGWDTPSQPSSSGVLFSTRSIGHLGYSGTSLWLDLEAECAVVLLSNRTFPSRENQKIKELRPVFHDLVRKSLITPAIGT